MKDKLRDNVTKYSRLGLPVAPKPLDRKLMPTAPKQACTPDIIQWPAGACCIGWITAVSMPILRSRKKNDALGIVWAMGRERSCRDKTPTDIRFNSSKNIRLNGI